MQGVENSKGGLGYFGFAYDAAHKDKLRAVPIDGGKGPVEASAENVINGTYQPLSRPLFMYVKVSAASRPEVQEFIKFCLTQGAQYVSESRVTCRCPRRPTRRSCSTSTSARPVRCSAACRRWASRSSSC